MTVYLEDLSHVLSTFHHPAPISGQAFMMPISGDLLMLAESIGVRKQKNYVARTYNRAVYLFVNISKIKNTPPRTFEFKELLQWS